MAALLRVCAARLPRRVWRVTAPLWLARLRKRHLLRRARALRALGFRPLLRRRGSVRLGELRRL
jgi:hypothetical protein